MLRKRAVAVALTALLSPTTFGLGLGTLKTNSALNEPFDASIEIVGAAVQDFDTLSAKLADTRQFQRAGLARDAVLLNLRFEVVSSEAGADFIRITTKDPVREPFLNFLLEIDWANGRMVREYTVLLDPPLYDRNRVQSLTTAPVPAPRPLAAPRPAAAPATTPTAGAAPAVAQAPAAAPAAPSDGNLGVVSANDTAWGLALRHRPDASVSVQQMMLALLRANPEAFANDNVNQLRRGAVLRMPTQAELTQLSQNEAVAEIQRQHQLWQDYRQGAASAPAPAPIAATPPAADDDTGAEGTPDIAEEAPPADEGHLELAAPEDGEATKTPGGEAGGSLDDSLAKEDLASKAQENSELAAKLEEADQIIDLLQRQVQIKDEELAALQKRLGEAGVEAPPATPSAAAEPATEETADTAPEPAPTPAPEPTAPSSPAPVAEAPAPTPEPAPSAAAPKPAPAPAPTAAAGPLDGLVPAPIRALVPGGTYTVLGMVATVLLLLVVGISKALGGKRDKAIVATKPAAQAAVAAAAAAPAASAEALASTREDLTAFDTSTPPAADPEQFHRTMEATAEELVAAPEDEDPLEEVNVYLAYERFDQAEELVRKVIAKYPYEHKYKLRLLEIYYSANDKQAYETAARELLDAVGDASPLWASALAMWGEMSPERALFAPGAEITPEQPVPDSTSAFVDITSENTAGGATMSMPPGGDDLLASTQVGLTNDFSGTSTLDFDLGDSFSGEAPTGQVLDLTSGEAPDDVIDLTATAATTDLDDVLDLTKGGDVQGPGSDDVFDISGEDLLDLGDTAENPQGAAGIDHTAVLEHAATAFDSTSPGPGSPDRAEAATVNAVADEDTQDFDISDTVAPAMQRLAETSSRPAPAPAADEDLSLDFDIEGLSEPVTAPVAGADTASANDDFDLTLDTDLEAELGASAESAIGDDLSIQDAAGLDFDIGAPAESGVSAESEVEFDLALQDTTDFESLSIDDTLELPKSNASRSMRPVDAASESLEDLTRSMEASIAGLDLDDEKDSILDLALEPGTDSIDLDFGLEDIGELNELDTLALDPEELRKAADAVVDRTLAMPRESDAEYSSAMDETDTKLNLAKAYIELGDGDGARTILNEVVSDGTPAQQEEARKLLSQLA